MISKVGLHAVDYVVIGFMLVIPMGIGVFFAVRDAKRTTREEYLLGGRRMSVIPVTLSLFATYMSAISMIGMPSDMYQYGPMYFGMLVGISFSDIVAYFTVAPLMHPLQLTSVYEYLEMRFQSRLVRLLGVVMGMLQAFSYSVIAMLAPGLALEAAAGIPLWLSVVIVGVTGTIYTGVGGIKSVVWTDVFQTVIMFVGLFTVIIKSSIEVGGMGEMLQSAKDGGRIDFDNFGPDPRIRYTWPGAFFGGIFLWMTNQFHQSTVQRLSSLPTLREARHVLVINMPLILFYATVISFVSWAMYAYFFHIRCDPFEAGLVYNSNQMTPFFVLHVLQDLPGMGGLFMAALFSGALSSVSSAMNSLAANTVEDLLQNCLKSVSEKRATLITKAVVFIFGTAIIAIAYLCQSLKGPVTQMSNAIVGTFGSCSLGMFLLGCTVPWINRCGVISGCLISLAINVWIVVGRRLYGKAAQQLPPVPSDQCFNSTLTHTNDFVSNSTTPYSVFLEQSSSSALGTNQTQDPNANGFFLYDMSYEWSTIIGVLVCYLVGLVVSRITASKTDTTEPRFILPCLRKFWKLPEDSVSIGCKDQDGEDCEDTYI